MKAISLAANPRVLTKTIGSKKLRNAGTLPGIVYGCHQEPMSFKVEARSLERALSKGGQNAIFLHPAAIAITSLLIFDVDPFAAGVMIAAAALPVAGNVYILAQHFGVAPQRVSAAILVSTAVSILTVPAVIHWVHG